MKTEMKLQIEKVENGWIVGIPSAYSNPDKTEIFTSFEDAVARMAERLGQTSFSSTVKQSQNLAHSLMEFCALAVAPKFTAIEARLNPGSENVIDVGE